MDKKQRSRAMYDTCLKCTLKKCLPESTLCDYFNKFGREMAPVLMQNFCGYPEYDETKNTVAKRKSRAYNTPSLTN